MPGLPWFCCTRFNAACTLPRSTTCLHAGGRSPSVRLRSPPARFAAPLGPRGFTPASERELQLLPGHLAPGVFEAHGRLALPSVRPFARSRLLWPRLTSRSAPRRRPFRRKARSPQVRPSAFPARPPDLRRLALGRGASRSLARSPWSTPPRIRFLFVGPRVRSPLPSAPPSRATPCGSLGSLRPGSPEDLHLQVSAHAGHTKRNGLPRGEPVRSWWRWGESNPRPRTCQYRLLHA